MGDRNTFKGKCEYAKSGRSKCKKCKTPIEQGSFRIAKLVFDSRYDAWSPHWYHPACFWQWKGSQKASSTDEFENFDSVKWEDQQLIAAKLSGGGGGASSAASTGEKKKAKKAKVAEEVERLQGCPPLHAEYAKSSRSKCRSCLEAIMKDEVRLGVDRPMEDREYIMSAKWFHRRCFIEGIQTEEYSDVPLAKIMPQHFDGWENLDKAEVTDLLGLFDAARVGAGMDKLGGSKAKVKKRKAEAAQDKEANAKKARSDSIAPAMKVQSEVLWEFRDALGVFDNSVLKTNLRLNRQNFAGTEETLKEKVSAGIMFGALQECPECTGTEWKVASDGYHCCSEVDEYVACEYVTQEAAVSKWKMSKTVSDVIKPIQKRLKCVKPVPRIFAQPVQVKAAPSFKAAPNAGAAKSPAAPGTPAAQPAKGPAKGMEHKLVAITAGLLRGKAETKKILEEHTGATLFTGKVGSSVTVMVSTAKEVDANKQKRLQDCAKYGVPIVSEAWLTECENTKSCVLIEPYVLACTTTIVEPSQEQSRKSQIGSRAGKEDKAATTVIVKGRCAVEVDSNLAESCHVLDEGHTVWNATMTYVNLRDDKNSYYKMQILQDDHNAKLFYVYRGWGRIGTTNGTGKVECHMSKEGAKAEFEDLFYNKTQNSWSARAAFVKHAKCYHYAAAHYQTAAAKSNVLAGSKSKLQAPVQDLINLIYDEDMLKQSMKEMEIDLTKMPLGAISKRAISDAFGELRQLEVALQDATLDDAAKLKLVKAHTTRFYAHIPHDHGRKQAPLIDTLEGLKAKTELLENLLAIEMVTRTIKQEENEDVDLEEDPLDTKYNALNAKMTPLDRDSEEFKMIEKYTVNTHAATHSTYKLKIENVFSVKRKGEKKTYNEKSAAIHNKRLLWHGSRLSNWVGILKDGLRIAPPEAPCTGYMFGKGVYFADMVSKSANYCFASQDNPQGLLMLSEVALGNMYERTAADYIEKLPDGTHSCFGVGQTMPSKRDMLVTDDGVTVPFGKAQKSGVAASSLLYNEYIVYDTAQIRQKYLIQVTFEFGRRQYY